MRRRHTFIAPDGAGRKRMRLRWSLAPSLLALLALSGSAPAEELQTRSWQSDGLGVRLTLPRGWYVAQESPDGRSVKLLPPAGKGQVALLAIPVDSGRAAELEALTREAIASLKKSIKKFKLTSQRDVEVAGQPAREIFYRGRVSDTKVRWLQTFFVHGQRQIFVIYVAPENAYLGNVPEYDQIVRSIHLLP